MSEYPIHDGGCACVECEVDRLRAENAEYRQMQKAFKAHMRAVEQVAAPLA